MLMIPTVCKSQKDGDVRLVGGSYSWEGRVGVYFSGSWGTIADSDWSSSDAQAVCNKLGYFRPGQGSVCFDMPQINEG